MAANAFAAENGGMASITILINRPVIIGPRSAVLARPAERALDAA